MSADDKSGAAPRRDADTSPIDGRGAYATARQQLDGFAAGADAAIITTVADEILAAAGVLASQPRLRRALADSSRSTNDRIGLLRSIFGGKFSAATADQALGLLGVLVGARWSSPRDLLGSTERLGVEALLASAERAGELAEVEDELFRFGQLVAGDSRLSGALSDPTVALDRRVALARDLLTGKARAATIRLVEVALAGLGGRNFGASLTKLVELAAERRDMAVAYVTAAVLPTEAQERRLGDALRRIYGRVVSLKIDVQPQIIGGMSVRVGADRYDGTVLRRLTETRQALTA